MTWTYSGDPSASTLEALRDMIGDVLESDQLLSDEEIVATSTTYPDLNAAAAKLCDKIAARFARKVDTTNGDLRVNASQRFKQYKELAGQFRLDSMRGASIYVGGRLLSEKETASEDTTITQPAFSRGRDDYQGTNESTDNEDDEE